MSEELSRFVWDEDDVEIEFAEPNATKFNPYHDERGRFASRPGGRVEEVDVPTLIAANPGITPSDLLSLVRKEIADQKQRLSDDKAVRRQETLERVEREIAGLSHERAVVIDEGGKVLINKDGQTSSVDFTYEEMQEMTGATLTHNHPGGTSFSPDDIHLAAQQSMAEIRAVGEHRRYSARPNENGWDNSTWTAIIGPAHRQIHTEVYAEFEAKIRRKEMSITEAEATHYDTVWKRVVAKTGAFVYESEAWDAGQTKAGALPGKAEARPGFTIDRGHDIPLYSPTCIFCRHWHRGERTCAAFPSGIPADIWYGDHDHRTPFPGDNGILFAPLESATKFNPNHDARGRFSSGAGGGAGGGPASIAETASEAGASVHYSSEQDSRGGVRGRIQALFGRELSDEEVAGLAGALPGMRVALSANEWDSAVIAEVSGGGMSQYMTHITGRYEDKPGYLSMQLVGVELHVDLARIERKAAGQALAARVLAHQAQSAERLGIEKISLFAVGEQNNPLVNGYYTWARYGFDAAMPYRVRRKLPEAFAKAERISDLMDKPGGRQWWREHGESWDGEFDTRAGSRSRRVLDAYLSEHAARKAEDMPDDDDLVDCDILSEEQEAILDRIWAGLAEQTGATKFNPWHDEEGKFTSRAGGGGQGGWVRIANQAAMVDPGLYLPGSDKRDEAIRNNRAQVLAAGEEAQQFLDALGSWQGTEYEGIRVAAKALVKGEDPDAALLNTSGWSLPEYKRDREGITDYARTMLKAVNQAPKDGPALYRGYALSDKALAKFKDAVGQTVDVPLTSFSQSQKQASDFMKNHYQQDGEPNMVIFHLKPRAKAVRVYTLVDRHFSDEDEWISGGRFKVTAVEKGAFGPTEHTRIVIEQVGTFTPPKE